MDRRRALFLATTLYSGIAGCGQLEHRPPASTAITQPHDAGLPPDLTPKLLAPIAIESDPTHASAEFEGPQPVEFFIRRALAENRTVQAAYHNVQSLKYRLPQVTSLDDPVASNVIFPIPSVAPQYFLMGYNPYNLTLAQQFPWFGTLRLRGEAAERDVQVALEELAAAQLDSVAAVKRAYFNLFASLKADEILDENRKVLEDFRAVAREKLRNGGNQQDVLRAELLIAELERERATNQQAIAAARAAAHARPDPRSRPDTRDPHVARVAADKYPSPRKSSASTAHLAQVSSPGASGPPRPQSRATRRPSSWPAKGFIRTSRSA